MRVEDFDFHLPPERIAGHPVRPRDRARLLRIARTGNSHHRVGDLPGLLRPGDLMVFNDTKVIPARLSGKRGEAKIEITLHKRQGAEAEGEPWPARWFAFARPAKKLKEGDRIDFGPEFSAQVAEKRAEGEVLLAFDRAGGSLAQALEREGAMPLPPYIKRARGPEAEDRTDYQTLFAAKEGAVAAPTAGLHFTPSLMGALSAAGIGHVLVTLHVGAGTFLPVKAERTEDHRMHAEYGEVSEAAVAAIRAAQEKGGRIVAVGTTSLRLLESAAGEGSLRPFAGETDIFITPGFSFRVADLLLTNFHLPRSTLFMLVAAFAGLARMKAAYAEAVRENYRFYSYGDCCLLDRMDGP